MTSMFRVTCLGHHGWLISSGESRLLVDPLLHARFGFTDSVEFRVYPPRRFHWERFPAVDAVMLTHEHEGHFDIASLNLLDRAIPVYLSSLSSLAMRQVIEEMGFELRLVRPGVRFTIGELEVIPMAADQGKALSNEEWDVIPYLVRDRAGHGSFFTSIDVPPSEAMWRQAREVVERPGLWAYTNNYNRWELQYSWSIPDQRFYYQLVKQVVDYHRQLSAQWERPAALLLVGGGVCFGGEREWVNREVFPCDSEEAAGVMARLLPGERVLAPLPGQTLVMRGGALVDLEPESALLGALPREEWPDRRYRGEVRWLEQYRPATGRAELAEGELAALEGELAAFAAFLYAREPFRRLYSLSAEELEGRRPTFAFVLRADEDGGVYVYEYEPRDCRFRAVDSEDPVSEYLAVYECYASDLLALLRAEISQDSLTLGRCRQWMVDLDLFDLDLYLMLYAHPLRQTARYLALYRRVLAAQPTAPLRIRRRES
jgi:hypothetical protein